MSNFVRRFWTPVMLANKSPESDCAPVRSKRCGEDLVAFRDTNGVIGLIDEFCPHRRASLFFVQKVRSGGALLPCDTFFTNDPAVCNDITLESPVAAYPHSLPGKREGEAA